MSSNQLSLNNRKIILCRRYEQSGEIVLALQKKKASPIVFPTFRLEPVRVSDEDKKKLSQINTYDWIILGSENGVRFFNDVLKFLNISESHFESLSIGVVGTKAAKAWMRLYPEYSITKQANSLQELLTEIIESTDRKSVSIINPTSTQSLKNIVLDVPDEIELNRIPVYQTVLEDSHKSEEIEFIRSNAYDAVFFGSPSAFDYFVLLMGNQSLKNKMPICVSGKTTAKYIVSAGYPVDIIPEYPDTENVVKAIEEYFESDH